MTAKTVITFILGSFSLLAIASGEFKRLNPVQYQLCRNIEDENTKISLPIGYNKHWLIYKYNIKYTYCTNNDPVCLKKHLASLSSPSFFFKSKLDLLDKNTKHYKSKKTNLNIWEIETPVTSTTQCFLIEHSMQKYHTISIVVSLLAFLTFLTLYISNYLKKGHRND